MTLVPCSCDCCRKWRVAMEPYEGIAADLLADAPARERSERDGEADAEASAARQEAETLHKELDRVYTEVSLTNVRIGEENARLRAALGAAQEALTKIHAIARGDRSDDYEHDAEAAADIEALARAALASAAARPELCGACGALLPHHPSVCVFTLRGTLRAARQEAETLRAELHELRGVGDFQHVLIRELDEARAALGAAHRNVAERDACHARLISVLSGIRDDDDAGVVLLRDTLRAALAASPTPPLER